MKLFVVLALMVAELAGAAPSVSPDAPLPPGFVPVFVAGQDGYACFRIPALVTATNGALLAMADGRISNCADIPNPIDLVLKRSFDQGRSWAPLQIIADYGKNTNDLDTYPASGITNPVARVAAGDAALLLDRTNGRVWVLYDNGAYVPGRPHHRALKLELRFSDDNGQTWSSGIDVEARNPGLRPAGTDFMASPGNGIQLAGGPHAGRLIFPVYVWAKPFYSSRLYRDDHGRSWRLGGNAGAGGGEMQIAEVSDGGLLATIRNNAFTEQGVRFFNTSPDGGETWGAPFYQSKAQPPLPDPKCQASLLRIPSTHHPLLLGMANAAHVTLRTNLTLRFSLDEGRTWPVSNRVYAGSAAYSALTSLAPEELGLLLEMDKYHRICFVRMGAPALAPK